MSFHIKCLFGKHDWEIVNTVNERKILESLGSDLAKSKIKGLDYRVRRHPINYRNGIKYKQKICLRCCTIKDEVAEYIRDFYDEEVGIEFDKFHVERRQEQAKSMSKTCAADKFVRI